MGRSFIPEENSAYYPRRARWYSPLFYLGNTLRRRLALDRLTLPHEMKTAELVAGFFVPGLAVWLRGPKLWGNAALVSCAALSLVFIIGLGYSMANLAFGLLISIHATGFVYYCNPLMASEPFRNRLAFTFLTLMAIGLLLYMPVRNFIQGHWLTPLRQNGHVIVVQRVFQAHNIHRGDWVAYSLQEDEQGEAHHGGAVWIRSGMGLGPVLAIAGDQIQFGTNGYSINGVLSTNLAHMPDAGTVIVPEKHWFIWPNLDISGHGNVGEGNVSSAMLSLASVNQSQFFGKPLQRWFWRKQMLP